MIVMSIEQRRKKEDRMDKKVKIRLTTDWGSHEWLHVEYFPARSRAPRLVDFTMLVKTGENATAVSLDEAKQWMKRAKSQAVSDGLNIVKGEYIYKGKPTSLAKVGQKAFVKC